MFMIKEVSKTAVLRLIVNEHYRKSLPRLNKTFLGWYVGDKLVAAMSLGWGVRPLHTIRKLFPSLTSQDYFEIGRLCLLGDMPKNSESHFISQCMDYVKKNYLDIKLIFTWADGLLGKPGYVYQASNFLFGGHIWTDAYFSTNGECIHPRTSSKVGGRLGIQESKNIKHFWGKQFRYVYFLCSNKERKQLLDESPIDWTMNYPKAVDLEWKKSVGGKRINCQAPFYDKSCNDFSDNAKANLSFIQNKSLLNFIYAGKDSRESHQFSKLKGLGQFQLSALQ